MDVAEEDREFGGRASHQWAVRGSATSTRAYDLAPGTRWLYAFLSEPERRVKIGLVLTEARLEPRLREVARKHGDVRRVAATPIPP